MSDKIKEENSILKNKITALEKKIQELEKFKQNILDIFEPLNALIFVIDKDGNYLYVSPTCPENLLIMPADELVGSNIKDILPPGLASFLMEYINNALKTKKTVSTEYTLPIQGKNVWFESRIVPILETDSEPTKVISIISDITRFRKKV